MGFPGETGEEFQETVEFLKKIRLYETHVFKYSRRKGTRAAEMPDQIPEQEKGRRSECLLELNRENKVAFLKEWTGRECEVLFEEKITLEGRDYFAGYTKEYIRAVMPGDISVENQILAGRLRPLAGEPDFLLFDPVGKHEKKDC